MELRDRLRLKGESLLDFIPRITPQWERPNHLAPVASVLERAETAPVRALITLPPRHSKTETLLHAIARYVRKHPDRTVAYVTLADRLTKSKSRLARAYARQAGVKLSGDSSSLNEWRTTEGGGALFTSIGGTIIGQGCQLLIVDDPHKDRAEAESQLIRDMVYDWLRGTALHRLEPHGSVVICHTRWHPDDLIGRLLKDDEQEQTWEKVFLPAIDETGKALWPSRWPVAELTRKRAEIGEYEWASLYQGSPRPRGGSVFHDVVHYVEPPKTFRVSIGVDLAYSAKTQSNYSVAVVMAECEGFFYILDVRRMQAPPPVFAGVLRQLHAAYPGAAMLWYASTTERGLADLMRVESRIPLMADLAVIDKFIRAQPVAAAWNAGRVLVPKDAEWAPDFISEVASFTGVADRHDDQVDALAAGFDALVRGRGLTMPRAFPTKFQGDGTHRRGTRFQW
jgi:predicted phage terminase large subunit-like protein